MASVLRKYLQDHGDCPTNAHILVEYSKHDSHLKTLQWLDAHILIENYMIHDKIIGSDSDTNDGANSEFNNDYQQNKKDKIRIDADPIHIDLTPIDNETNKETLTPNEHDIYDSGDSNPFCIEDRTELITKQDSFLSFRCYLRCAGFQRLQAVGRRYITTQAWFQYFIISCIFVNCVFIAIQNPTTSPNSSVNKITETAETVFCIIFTVEMVIKMVCNGLFYQDKDDPNHVAYFRDTWNLLDFIIVITSFIEFLPLDTKSNNLTAIRVLRVLRPLRTITKFKKLKILITTIISSIRGLTEVLVLILFLFVLFTIFGVQTFNGLLHRQCFSDNFIKYENNGEKLWLNNELYFINGQHFCFHVGTDKNNGCPTYYPWCLDIAPNPNNGLTNFDNFAYAMLNVFVTISLEGWTQIMYMLQAGGATFCWIYFVLLTFTVGFFVINLFLAIIESIYEMEMKHLKEKQEEQENNNCRDRAKCDTEKSWMHHTVLLEDDLKSNEDDLILISPLFQASNSHNIYHSKCKRDHHDQRRVTRLGSTTTGINRTLGIGAKSFVETYRMVSSVKYGKEFNDNDVIITDDNNITIKHAAKKNRHFKKTFITFTTNNITCSKDKY
eukprot:38005_1